MIVSLSSLFLYCLFTGASGVPVIGGTANPTTGAIPKAPTSQSPAMNSKISETPNTAKGRIFKSVTKLSCLNINVKDL